MPSLTVESKSSAACTALPENRLQFYLFSYPIAELMNHQCDRFIDIAIEEPDSENLATGNHTTEYGVHTIVGRLCQTPMFKRGVSQNGAGGDRAT
jgi:hypothetical protein